MNRCIPCGYDLAGRAVGERCPECGAPVPPMDLGGAWNDAVVRRRFAIGAWLFMAVVPAVRPGVLVSWLADFHPRVTFWLVAVPPIACAFVAAVLIDRGRPQPAVRRRRPGAVMAIGMIPLLALAAAIATMLDIGRARGTAGLVAFSLMLVFAAAMGVCSGWVAFGIAGSGRMAAKSRVARCSPPGRTNCWCGSMTACRLSSLTAWRRPGSSPPMGQPSGPSNRCWTPGIRRRGRR